MSVVYTVTDSTPLTNGVTDFSTTYGGLNIGNSEHFLYSPTFYHLIIEEMSMVCQETAANF